MKRNIANIEETLKTKNIAHQLIEHNKKIHSAKEGAEYFGIDIGQTAPSLILLADEKLYALIMSGSRNKVDFEKIKCLLNAKNVEMASKSIIASKLGFEVGIVPMINLPIPCIIDNELLKYDFIYGGTGIKNVTLKVNPSDLKVLNENYIVTDEL